MALSDDRRFNPGCTDGWGTHHQCEGCLYNRCMGDGSAFTANANDNH